MSKAELAREVHTDDFQALEQKIYRTVEQLKAAREAKHAAERDATRLREQVEVREEEIESLRREVIALRREREEVRGRVEKMLKHIESLAGGEDEG